MTRSAFRAQCSFRSLFLLLVGASFSSFFLFPSLAEAQEISISLDGDGSFSGRVVQLFILLTVLSLVPGLAMMITCFPFMVTVLAILRQGIGLQQSPPNMLIMSLALVLTYFVMQPVFNVAWQDGIQPMLNDDIALEDLDFAMASPEVYRSALEQAGFQNITLRNRNPWYRDVAKAELDFLTGDSREELDSRHGADYIAAQEKTWRALVGVLASGEHCPHHIRGQRQA